MKSNEEAKATEGTFSTNSIWRKIEGSFEIKADKVSGNKIEDVIELSSDPIRLRRLFFGDEEPIIMSISAFVTYPTQKLVFRIVLNLGLSIVEPVVLDMPKGFMKNPAVWVERNLLDYPKTTRGFLDYVIETMEVVLPILVNRAEEIMEGDTMRQTVCQIYRYVEKQIRCDDVFVASHFKVKTKMEIDGQMGKYYCICGKKAFAEMLSNINSEFSKKEILKSCDNWHGGSLLIKDKNRYDHKFHSSDSERWVCIKESSQIVQGDQL